MDPKNYEAEKRKQNRLEKLGPNPRCLVCGDTRWWRLEIHHVADHGCDPTTVILCANHHKDVTEAQKDHPPHVDGADPLLEAAGRLMRGIAELFKLLIDKLIEFGDALIARANTAGEGTP